MFEHFTFGAAPQTQYQHVDDAFPSPTDTSFPSPLTPPPSCFPFPSNPHQAGINDIVTKFSQQTLHQKSRDELVQQFQAWQMDQELEIDDEESDQVTQTMSLPPTPILSSTNSVTCRRLQRQLNVQLQSCDSHVKDINSLVEDMIVSNEQCRLRKVESRAYLSSPPPSRGRDLESLMVDPTECMDVDEGFCEDEGFMEEEMVSLRRASTPSGIRKYNGIRYGRSADLVSVGGRIKVKRLPRMRSRKVPRVPE